MSLAAEAKRYAAVSKVLEFTGERVRAHLQQGAAAKSQKTVAAALGISPQYLNDILHGRRPITRELVERIIELSGSPRHDDERV